MWYMFDEKIKLQYKEYFVKTLSGKVCGTCMPCEIGFKETISNNIIPKSLVVTIRLADEEEIIHEVV